jgi:hypothetical protein
MADDLPRAVVHGDLPARASQPATSLTPEVRVLPTYRLYTPTQVAVAALIGSPVAGCFLLSRNAKRMGRSELPWLLVGIAWTAGLLAFAVTGTTEQPTAFASLGSVGVVAILARSTQGVALQYHQRAGGARGSWSVAIGAGLVALAIVFAVLFGAGQLLTPPPKVDAGSAIVYYEDGATRAEARLLAARLGALGYFDDAHPARVKLHRNHDRRTISFALTGATYEDRGAQRAFAELAEQFSRLLGGEPVDLWLCDESWDRHVALVWENRPR